MTTPETTTDDPTRSLLRAWAEVRGFVGGFSHPHEDLVLRTADGVRLAATLLPAATSRPRGEELGIVLLHGFAAHRRKPAYAWLAEQLTSVATVLAPDLRGHGRSAGVSGLGASEVPDVAAAVDELRGRGHDWVGLVGVSMGATAAANALPAGVDADAVALVSGPARIELEPTTDPMRRMGRLWRSRLGRLGLRVVTGVRVAAPRTWTAPVDPAVAVAGTATPLLVVHGADDAWFPSTHADAVVAGVDGAVLWLEPGFGHAEDGFRGSFGRRLAAALLTARRTGTFPPRQELPW